MGMQHINANIQYPQTGGNYTGKKVGRREAASEKTKISITDLLELLSGS